MSFKCPKCGSEFFRTDIGADPWVRYCKGRLRIVAKMVDYEGCDFSWPETDDDKHGLEGEHRR